MGASLHLLKLCVGAEGVQDLADWQAQRAAAGEAPLRTVTRMWPKRAEALLAGGSLYWVFKGLVLARQRILALEPHDHGDGVERCAIALSPEIVRTVPQPRRPFQGWRYLPAAEAPDDLADVDDSAALPPDLQAALSALGVAGRRTRCG
jgi:hypothetical protein